MSKEMNKLSEEIANGYLFETNVEASKDTDDSVGASEKNVGASEDNVGASIASPSVSKNYPIVDGSTANMPMMAQIRADYLGEDLETAENNVRVTTTDYSWRALIDGNADLLLVYEPSSETKEIIEKSDVELEVVPIGVDALVFIGNENNKVDSLTTEQIQDIYTGKITNWKELGGDDLKIEAFQRPLNSGSQTLFLNLVMKDKKPMDPPTRYVSREMADLIEDLASYNEQNSAIGYSVFYYAKKMYEKPGLKLLTVDNVTPSDETIANGEYPFLNQYYLVIRKNEPEDSETRKLFNYILSDKGTEAIKKSGYIPVKK
jgi:phosphate transport system substrate-binding protein